VKRIEVTVPMSIRSTERDELITAIQNATGLEEISLTRKSTKGYYVVSDQESYGYVGKTVAAIDQFCAANNLGWKRLKEEPGGLDSAATSFRNRTALRAGRGRPPGGPSRRPALP
jgi:hypothetical protein